MAFHQVEQTDQAIRVLSRGVAILKAFSVTEPELGPSEIARRLKIPKTSAHRILVNLTDHGILQRCPKNGRYRLGRLLYTLGSIYLTTTDILTAGRPVIRALNQMTGEDVNLGILEGSQVVIILREQAKHPFRLNLYVGSVLPAYPSAIGKALLSELSNTEIDTLYPGERLEPLTERTVATRAQLKLQLDKIRASGFAHNEGEAYDGVESFGSLIRDGGSRAIAGLCMATPVFRMSEELRKRLPRLVKMGCSLISYQLGYRDKQYPVHDILELEYWWEKDEEIGQSKRCAQ